MVRNYYLNKKKKTRLEMERFLARAMKHVFNIKTRLTSLRYYKQMYIIITRNHGV